MTEHALYLLEGAILTIAAGAAAVWLVATVLSRSRPHLPLRQALLAAFAIRVAAAGAVGLTSMGPTLRGGDEEGFLFDAHQLAGFPFSSAQWSHTLTGSVYFHLGLIPIKVVGSLHVFLMGLQIKLFGASEFGMRSTMAAVSVIGIAFLVAAVYELAGPRPATLAAWLLAIEPANIFFSTALHKEPTIYLAIGLVAFGAARFWRKAGIGPAALMVLGCVVALVSRRYAGWFLVGGCGIVILHAALRHASSRIMTSVSLATVVLGVGVISSPALVQASSKQELTSLQTSQNANSTDTSNLKLEPIDFSSRRAIAVNLPRRVFDLLFRPYPWQLGNASQRLGVLETVFVLMAMFLLVRAIVRRSRPPLAAAGPLIYPAFMLTVAYALAVGNAGTGFRYRTEIMPLIIGTVLVLRTYTHQTQSVAAPTLRGSLVPQPQTALD